MTLLIFLSVITLNYSLDGDINSQIITLAEWDINFCIAVETPQLKTKRLKGAIWNF